MTARLVVINDGASFTIAELVLVNDGAAEPTQPPGKPSGDSIARCDVGAFDAGAVAASPLEIPALGSLGLLILVCLLGSCAVVVLKRRSRSLP